MPENLLEEQVQTLIEYNYRESDIPLTHKYWDNKSRLAQLTSSQTSRDPKLPVPVPKAEESKVEEPKTEEPIQYTEEPQSDDFNFMTEPKND